MTPLEQVAQDTIKEQARLRDELRVATQMWKAAEEREAILKGRVEQLELEIEHIRDRSDHNLQWAVEITKQLHNIGMFVSDALNLARHEVRAAQGNGRDVQSAIDAVQRALAADEPEETGALQHQTEQRQISSDKVQR